MVTWQCDDSSTVGFFGVGFWIELICNHWSICVYFAGTNKYVCCFVFFCRANIDEVESEVVEIEAKLDKVREFHVNICEVKNSFTIGSDDQVPAYQPSWIWHDQLTVVAMQARVSILYHKTSKGGRKLDSDWLGYTIHAAVSYTLIWKMDSPCFCSMRFHLE